MKAMTKRERSRKAAALRARALGPPSLPEWPADEPRPSFASEAEEVAFLRSYSFADYWRAGKAIRIEGAASALLPSGDRGPQGSFAHLRVLNSGPFAPRVRCAVRFLRRDGSQVFEREMPARWSNAPEPVTPVAVREANGQRIVDWVFDMSKVALGYVADFAPKEEHAAAIALKFDDGTCWGWPPDSYQYGGRHPNWKLPLEPLVVRAHVLANGRDYFSDFNLDTSAAPSDFSASPLKANGHDRSPLPSEEVATFQRKVVELKILSGGLAR
jgi:hypothetical protein